MKLLINIDLTYPINLKAQYLFEFKFYKKNICFINQFNSLINDSNAQVHNTHNIL